MECKAFDVIDYELLLKKMFIYDAGNNCVVSFQSCLEIRRQFVKFGAITSEQISVTQRLAEESILGPVLFLLLVNDMSRLYLNTSTITVYADDITLSLSSDWSDISTLSPLLSHDLEDIENWFRENKTYTYIKINKTETLLVVKKCLR